MEYVSEERPHLSGEDLTAIDIVAGALGLEPRDYSVRVEGELDSTDIVLEPEPED